MRITAALNALQCRGWPMSRDSGIVWRTGCCLAIMRSLWCGNGEVGGETGSGRPVPSATRFLRRNDSVASRWWRGPNPDVGYALWAEATEQIQKYGAMVKSPNGFPIQSPYLSIANRQAEIMMRIASEFGFTPASRSRISAPAPHQLPLFEESEEQS